MIHDDIAPPRRDFRGGACRVRSLAWFVLASCFAALPGCGGVSGTSGDEGTVSLTKSQEAAAKNPAIAKKSASLGGGVSTPGSKAKD